MLALVDKEECIQEIVATGKPTWGYYMMTMIVCKICIHNYDNQAGDGVEMIGFFPDFGLLSARQRK